MKAIYLLIISLFISQMLQAQVEKKVENTAGNLSTLLTPTELNSVTDLTIAGTMDARDFMTIRKMYWLTTLDLSGISVLAYPGGANGEVYNAKTFGKLIKNISKDSGRTDFDYVANDKNRLGRDRQSDRSKISYAALHFCS